MPAAGVYFIERDDDFERYQEYDNNLQSQRALVVDDIGQCGCCVRNDRQLPVQCLDTFPEVIFVFPAGIEPLKVGPIPENVRLPSDGYPARHAMLNQQRVPHELEKIGPVSGGLPQVCQFAGERLDGIEYVCDLPFVMPEHASLG